ncbi:MAG: class I SAM-dependent methyltransferase [Verrucomicrobia bacterium]|nr:class I SAM-dependent methyltransferase [Verrucomicrobiota bacterium]
MTNPRARPDAARADGGSYRDPDSFVFYHGGRVCRAVSPELWPALEAAWQGGVIETLIRDGVLIGSELVPEGSEDHEAFSRHFPGMARFVLHQRVPSVSYPYEWSFSMLADAALLHLTIQEALLKADLSLKDATAFNVQFVRGRPVLIDLGSIEKPGRRDVWVAYSQFCRMFLYPLALQLFRGMNFRQIFLADVQGISAEETYKLLGFWRSFSPAFFMDVFLQRQFNRADQARVRRLKPQLTKGSGDPAVQVFNLRRLARKVKKLRARYTCAGPWSEYEQTHSYAGSARGEKEEYVGRFLKTYKPATVLDLGCNTGVFSLMAAREGAQVVAMDGDHDCVEMLYRKVREEQLPILPLVINLTNPSPAIGFDNRERLRFADRIRGETVLALALVHHLLVSGNLSLAAIRDLMAGLTTKYLVIEFVEREDEMFQTLLALRKDTCGTLSLQTFVNVFQERFDLLDSRPLAGTRRHLLTMQRRA